MKLPGAEKAVVDPRKLEDYCLDPAHPRGRHKARVFASALGLGRRDAGRFREALLAAAARADAREGAADRFGCRYVVDFPMVGPHGPRVVRSRWIVRTGETFPRFVTAYVV